MADLVKKVTAAVYEKIALSLEELAPGEEDAVAERAAQAAVAVVMEHLMGLGLGEPAVLEALKAAELDSEVYWPSDFLAFFQAMLGAVK